MSRKWVRISSKNATFATILQNDIIIDSAPIVKKFIGKSFRSLLKWYYDRKIEIKIDEIL